MEDVIALIERHQRIANPRSAPRTWLRDRAATTPGRLTLICVLLIIGALCFGAVASSAERSRERSAQAVGSAAEPLLVQAATLYTTLSDANATATTTFLRGGLEPAARHAHYLQDLRSASAALATLTRDVGSSTQTSSAVRTLAVQLPVYAGLVEAARANNRQGFPVGAAYLRQASELLTATILPAANRLYATEAQRLSNDYSSGAAPSTLVLLGVAAGLALILLFVVQRYLARVSRRIFSVPVVLGTLILAAISIWALTSLVSEQDALARARGHSDGVEVLSGARVLLSRAQSDQSLTLVNRGSDETDPADFVAVMRALSPSGGLLGAASRPGSGARSTTTRVLGADFARYRANAAEIATLQRQGLTLEAIGRASSVKSTAVADRLQADLAAQIRAAQADFRGAASDATGSLGGLWPALPILTALSAALALVGLLARLGEYR